jgi:hypothetical protein
MKSLVWADTPSMLVEVVFALLVLSRSSLLRVGTYEGSYIGAGAPSVLATGQGLIIGYLLQKRFWS